ncbi:O-antigen ligase family protein [Pseudothermotoga sp.]|uniref:O-antigen ligase family protein n=1 Tax=Pseudothermotoga sp. TaxID=2033661 RepID=UPI0031F65D7A
MKRFEEALLHVGIIVVALLANRSITYEFSVPKYAAITAFTLLLIVFLLFDWSKKNKFELELYIPFTGLLWFVFSLIALLSTTYVLRVNRYYFKYSIMDALYILLTVFMAFYFANRIIKKGSITRLLLTFLAAGMVIAMDGLLNFYTGTSIFFGRVGEPFDRNTIKSSVGNVIFVTNYLVMLLPVSLYFVISNDYGWENAKKRDYILTKIFSTVYFLLALVVTAIGQTRSEYIALVTMVFIFILFYAIYWRKKEQERNLLAEQLKRFNKIVTVLLMILCAVVLIVYNTDNPLTVKGTVSIVERFAPEVFASNAEERILAWLSAVEQWKMSKLIGTGIGTYQIYAIEGLAKVMEKHPRFVYVWNNFKRTHNDYFQVLGETGILGLSIIVTLSILLALYALNRFKNIQKKDDFLLFLAMSMGFVGFMIQSVFSFPAHLLPNGLLAIFYASVATSVYFNPIENGFLIWKIKLRGFKLAVLLIVVLFTTISTTYLKWNHFISEVYFKNGSSSYNFLSVLDSEKSKLRQLESDITNKLKELEELTGSFVSLRPENFKVDNLNPIEIEKRRVSQIASIRTSLLNDLEKVKNGLKNIEQLQQQHFKLAVNNLLKSAQLNHTYGKSHFYLASLCLRGERINSLASALREGKTSVLTQSFDEYQKLIAPQYKSSDLAYFINLKGLIDESLLANMQALLDSCALFKTSLLSFNERNTYKALASRYAMLSISVKQLKQYLEPFAQDEAVQIALAQLDDLSAKYRSEFIYWAEGTVYRLPGSWNRYPEWKNINAIRAAQGEDIYRSLAVMMVNFEPLDSEHTLEFMKRLASKEVWACEAMAAKGVWAVPDGVAPILLAAAQKLQSKDPQMASEILKFMLERYKTSRELIMKELGEIELKSEIDSYLKEISKSVADSLTKEAIPSVRINTAQTIIEGFSAQIETQLKQADWKQAIKNEILAFQKGNFNVAYSLVANLPNTMLSQLQKILSNLVKDQNKINQILQQISQVVNNVPERIWLWERYSRFIAIYETLEEVSQ